MKKLHHAVKYAKKCKRLLTLAGVDEKDRYYNFVVHLLDEYDLLKEFIEY